MVSSQPTNKGNDGNNDDDDDNNIDNRDFMMI